MARIAARQLSLVTPEQARDHLTREQLEYRLSTGQLEVFRRAVYRFTGSAPSRWQPQLAACLAAGGSSVTSHWAPAELWGMPDVVASAPDAALLGAYGRRGLPVLRQILHRRRADFSPGDSPKEVELARVLTDAGLPTPVCQHQVVAGGRVYLLDLAYPDRRVATVRSARDSTGSRPYLREQKVGS